MKSLLSVTLLCLGFLSSTCGAAAAELAPDALVRGTTDEVLSILKSDPELRSGNQAKTLQLIEAKIVPHFDFSRMTRLAVGKNWRSATPQQQQALVNEFRTLLVRTYSTALSSYKDQTVEVKPLKLKPSDEDVTVKMRIIQPGAHPVEVDYSMARSPAGWKAYDVIIGGVSLVTNYRSSFDSQIAQGGMDGLIKTLAERNKGGSASDKPAAKADKK